MWTALFLVLAVTAVVVMLGEWYDRCVYRRELKECVKSHYLKDYCQLLTEYEEGCVGASVLNDHEVAFIKRRLNRLASRVSVYYPGFTAPTLD